MNWKKTSNRRVFMTKKKQSKEPSVTTIRYSTYQKVQQEGKKVTEYNKIIGDYVEDIDKISEERINEIMRRLDRARKEYARKIAV